MPRHNLYLSTIVSVLLLAACSSGTEDDISAEDAGGDGVTQVGESAVPPAPPENLDGDAELRQDKAGDYAAPMLTPEAEKGEKGARNVLLEWARALENRHFERAYYQWADNGNASGLSIDAYRRLYAKYETITVTVGLGEVEGAAGSLYYKVPVTITGTLPTGGSEVWQGPVTVKRVNDVPGATEEQNRWHLAKAELAPPGN